MTREETLKAAIEAICIDRERTHGPPQEFFERLAHQWTGYLRSKGVDMDVSIEDVVRMMIIFKLVRSMSGIPNTDDAIDIAGYAGILGEMT